MALRQSRGSDPAPNSGAGAVPLPSADALVGLSSSFAELLSRLGEEHARELRLLREENAALSLQVKTSASSLCRGGVLPPLREIHQQECACRDPKDSPLFQDLRLSAPAKLAEIERESKAPAGFATPAGEGRLSLEEKLDGRSGVPVRKHRQARSMPLPPAIDWSDDDAGSVARASEAAWNSGEDSGIAKGEEVRVVCSAESAHLAASTLRVPSAERSQQQACKEGSASEDSEEDWDEERATLRVQDKGGGSPAAAATLECPAISDDSSPSGELSQIHLPNCMPGDSLMSADEVGSSESSSRGSDSDLSDEELDEPERLTSGSSVGQVLPIWLAKRRQGYRGSIFGNQAFGLPSPGGTSTIPADPDAPSKAMLRAQPSGGFRKTETHMITELRDQMSSVERCCSKRTLRPNSKTRLFWDVCGMVLVTYDLIVIPLNAFGTFETTFTSLMSWVTTIFWMMDIPCSFMTGFHVDGIVELRPVVIARRYAQSWLAFDLIVVFVDLLISMVALSSEGAMAEGDVAAARLGRALRFLRLFRLLRLLKVSGFIDELCKRIHISDYFLIMLGIGKLLVFIVVINHLLACTWYAVGTLDMTREDAWVVHNGLPDTGFWYRYFTALHWSITQFTPASMEVVPKNNIERGFTVCVILFAMVTFSSFISTITAAMTQLRNLNSDTIEKQTRLRQYLTQNKISADLTCRVWGCLKTAMAKDAKRIYATEVPLLSLLPWHVKLDLRDQVFRPMLSWHPFFQRFSGLHHAEQDKIYQTALEEFFHGPGQEIFCAADAAEKMYFVVSGELKFFQEMVVDTVVSQEEWVTEPVLWIQWRHTGRLITQTRCELIGLNAGSAHKVLKLFDEPAKYARAFAKFCQQHPERITDVWADPELLDRIAEAAFTKPRPISMNQILPSYEESMED